MSADDLERNLRAIAKAPGYVGDICNQAAERLRELEAALEVVLSVRMLDNLTIEQWVTIEMARKSQQ